MGGGGKCISEGAKNKMKTPSDLGHFNLHQKMLNQVNKWRNSIFMLISKTFLRHFGTTNLCLVIVGGGMGGGGRMYL